jgi:hypothetical protein
VYLNANLVGNTTAPGIGLDGVFRDPWGQPFSKAPNSKHQAPEKLQYSNSKHAGTEGTGDWTLELLWRLELGIWSFRPVWSAGPDKMIDPAAKANASANKDNIVSWK